jgi:hypothetical protein
MVVSRGREERGERFKKLAKGMGALSFNLGCA